MALPQRLFLFTPLERMIAWRYLRPRRKEGFISIIAAFSFLGILLGVATLIIVMSVMNGFRIELMGRLLGYAGHISINSAVGEITDYDAHAAAIRRIGGVTSASVVIDGQAMANANNYAVPAQLRGMKQEDLRAHKLFSTAIRSGSFDSFKDDAKVVILGHRMAQQLGVQVGDTLRLTIFLRTPISTAVGDILTRTATYRVAAIFDVGMSEIDRLTMLMPLGAAQTLMEYQKDADTNKKDAVSNIEVMIDAPERSYAVGRAINGLSLPNLQVQVWQRRYETYFNALETERQVMFLILTLIVVVAAFNIISSLIMLVKDKTQAIAILRTMGATRGTIMRIFMMCGGAIGVIGTLAGVGVALLICNNIDSIKRGLEWLFGMELFSAVIYFLSRLPAVVNPREVIEVAAMGLVLSLLATIYPSWKAARLDPVEALRNE